MKKAKKAKNEDLFQFSCNASRSQIEQLKELARSENRSLSDLVRTAIKMYLQNHDKDNK